MKFRVLKGKNPTEASVASPTDQASNIPSVGLPSPLGSFDVKSSRGGTVGLQRRINANVYQRRRFVSGDETGGDSTRARALTGLSTPPGTDKVTANFGRGNSREESVGGGGGGGGPSGWDWNKQRAKLHAQEPTSFIPFFAAGYAYASTSTNTLMVQTYYSRGLLPFVESMLGIQNNVPRGLNESAAQDNAQSLIIQVRVRVMS